MISKRNKVRISGSFRHVLVLPITLATLVSSCVEGDLYDLYDEDELMLSGMIRKSKQNIVDPNPWWQNNDNITTGYIISRGWDGRKMEIQQGPPSSGGPCASVR